CSAACIASGVSARPSRPPAPSRTMSFSRSITSNDKSGRTRTTIMCRELVPMSMAAMRIAAGVLHYNGCLVRLSIMSASRPRHVLLRKRLQRFTRLLHGVHHGDVRAVHQTRVACRRLRELLPVIQLDGDLGHKLNRRLRKLTNRLGELRELDVLVQAVDDLRQSGRFSDRVLG